MGKASMFGHLHDFDTYRGLFRDSTRGQRVIREVYEIPEDHVTRTLKALDAYEGKEFVRKRVYVTIAGGKRRIAWVYLLCKQIRTLQ